MLEFLCGVLLTTLMTVIVAGYVSMREQRYLAYVHGTLAGVTAGAGITWLKQHPDDLEMGNVSAKTPLPKANVMLEFARLVHVMKGKTC